MKKVIKHLSLKSQKVKKEFKKQSVTAIVAAFAFLIALSWKDFITGSVTQIVSYFGVSDQLYLYKLLTALIITFIAIFGILLMSRFKEEPTV